jgi:hypothetical protein
VNSLPEHDAPVEIIDLSVSCVRFVESALGIQLDFTADTLPLLDHYLREARSVSREEVLGLIAPAAGAYFGEVVRRHLGDGRWHLTTHDYPGFRLEFERCYLSFNPIGAALEAVLGEPVRDFGAHLQLMPEDVPAVKASLERTGDVRDDDYYRLAVRLEVIEQVAALLSERALGKDGEAPFFGPEIYAAFRETPEPQTLH